MPRRVKFPTTSGSGQDPLYKEQTTSQMKCPTNLSGEWSDQIHSICAALPPMFSESCGGFWPRKLMILNLEFAWPNGNREGRCENPP